MAETPPSDIAWIQQTALLDTTLTRIIRYAQLLQAGLRAGEIDLAHADQLGQSTLVVLKKSAVIADRAEKAARPAA